MSRLKIETSGPPLTFKDLERFQEEIGLSLPSGYRRFLLKHNGGRPHPGCFRDTALGGEFINSVTEFLPLLPEPNNDLRELWREAQAELPRGFLPFARDVGMELLCFRTIPDDPWAVYLTDGFVEYLGREPTLDRLAPSFEAFLDMLFDQDASKAADPIERLASEGRAEDVTRYLETGGTLDDRSALGDNLVQTAAAQGNLGVLKACMESGADCSGALTVAIYNHKWEIMRYLVEAGADVNEVYGETGKRPLQAVYGVFGAKRQEIEDFLKEHGAH